MSLMQPLLTYKIIPSFSGKVPSFENELLSPILGTISFQLLLPDIFEWLRRQSVSKEWNPAAWKIIYCLLAYLERASLFCALAEGCCCWTIGVRAPLLLNNILEVHAMSHSSVWGALLIWLITLPCLPFTCWLTAVRARDVLHMQ